MKQKLMNNKLFEYEFWANDEIIKAIVSLDEPSEKVLSIMSHIMNAQILWLCRIKGETPKVKVWELYDKTDLPKVSKQVSEELKVYLETLNDIESERIIVYVNSKGESFESSVRDILIHLTHHSSYHRGQIVSLLKDKVSPVPYVDYIHFVRTHQDYK